MRVWAIIGRSLASGVVHQMLFRGRRLQSTSKATAKLRCRTPCAVLLHLVDTDIHMHGRRILAIAIAGLLAGCTGSFPTAPTTPESRESEGIEKWGCGDYSDGCWLNCPVNLTADFHIGTGTVEIADTVQYTRFELKGLERRWDWCLEADGSYGCAFVLAADGVGRYYDFTSVMPDSDGARRTKPADLFKCTHQR